MINVHLLIACFCVLISLCNDFHWQSDLQLQPTIPMPWRTCTHSLSLSLFWFENAFSIRGIGSRWCVVLVSLLHLFYTDLIAIYPPINYKTNKHQGIAYHLIWFHCQCARNTKLLFSLITFPFFTFGKLTRVLFVVSLSLSRSMVPFRPTGLLLIFFSLHPFIVVIHLPFSARFVCTSHNMCASPKWL